MSSHTESAHQGKQEITYQYFTNTMWKKIAKEREEKEMKPSLIYQEIMSYIKVRPARPPWLGHARPHAQRELANLLYATVEIHMTNISGDAGKYTIPRNCRCIYSMDT